MQVTNAYRRFFIFNALTERKFIKMVLSGLFLCLTV